MKSTIDRSKTSTLPESTTIKEVIEELRRYPEDTVVNTGAYFKDSAGNTIFELYIYD